MNIFIMEMRTCACNYLSIKIWQLLHSLCMQICVGVCTCNNDDEEGAGAGAGAGHSLN